jgi:hypothetical protein
MRDRLYRRYVEEKHIIKRLRRKINWYGKWYRDANNLPVNKILISSFLNKKEYFDSKNISTNKSETKLKIKYSNSYYPHKGIKTRKFDKIQFLKILKEYGIK